jgi:hypothetical protein
VCTDRSDTGEATFLARTAGVELRVVRGAERVEQRAHAAALGDVRGASEQLDAEALVTHAIFPGHDRGAGRSLGRGRQRIVALCDLARERLFTLRHPSEAVRDAEQRLEVAIAARPARLERQPGTAVGEPGLAVGAGQACLLGAPGRQRDRRAQHPGGVGPAKLVEQAERGAELHAREARALRRDHARIGDEQRPGLIALRLRLEQLRARRVRVVARAAAGQGQLLVVAQHDRQADEDHRVVPNADLEPQLQLVAHAGVIEQVPVTT